MSIPEHTVYIISQSCDSASRKRLVHYILTGSWLDTVPIPNAAKYAGATITRLEYPGVFVNIIECDFGAVECQNGLKIFYGDFTSATNYFSIGHYYDWSVPEICEKRQWLNSQRESTVWAQGDSDYIKNIPGIVIGPDSWASYILNKFGIAGEYTIVYSFVPIDATDGAARENMDSTVDTPHVPRENVSGPLPAPGVSQPAPGVSQPAYERETIKNWLAINADALERWRDRVDPGAPIRDVVCSYLVVNDMPMLVKYAKNTGFPYNDDTIAHIVAFGSLACVKKLIENECGINIPLIYKTAAQSAGYLEIYGR